MRWRSPGGRFSQISPLLRTALLCFGLSGVAAYDFCTRTALAIAFNFQPSASTPDYVIEGFNQAASFWSSIVQDDVTVNLEIDFAELETGVLGRTITSEEIYDYESIYQALQIDRSTSYDQAAFSSLSDASDFDLLINYTSDSPLGYGSPTPYLDDDGGLNNQSIRITTANAKALNLVSVDGSGSDGTITINPQPVWDFDRADGITAGAYDFVGVAAHEIGHALGFISGVDFLDGYSPYSVNGFEFFFPENSFRSVSILDLFRFSEESTSYGSGVIDWTATETSKYFSIDGGATELAEFTTGINHGDGDSASHWVSGSGLMGSRLNQNTLLEASLDDLIAFDVIGWDLTRSFVSTMDLTSSALSLIAGDAENSDTENNDAENGDAASNNDELVADSEDESSVSPESSDAGDDEPTLDLLSGENTSGENTFDEDTFDEDAILIATAPALPAETSVGLALRSAEYSQRQPSQTVPEPSLGFGSMVAIALLSIRLFWHKRRLRGFRKTNL